MSIVLRPHHLLCTQGYSGKGYDNDFVAHMTDVVHQLRDVPGTTIHLTFSTDTLCSCCPNKLGTDLCDTQEKVKRYDAKTVEYFGLEEKDYVYQDLIREIDAKATPKPRQRSSPTSAATAAGSPSAPAARISAKAGM